MGDIRIVGPGIYTIVCPLMLVDYLIVQADKPWYNYYFFWTNHGIIITSFVVYVINVVIGCVGLSMTLSKMFSLSVCSLSS